MLNLPTQHKLCILQRLIVQQPVQFCPLCRGAAVLVLHGDAVDGKGSATLEPGFHPVGVYVVVGFVELPFYIREGRRQIVRVLWSESRTETVEAVPVDVALGSFRVDVLTVGKVETAVIVFGVVSAVGSGSSVVSC